MLNVKVILKNDIKYVNIDNIEIFISKGTEISVDPESEIGYFNMEHFGISPDEYSVMFLN